jgi:hypothetical protein
MKKWFAKCISCSGSGHYRFVKCILSCPFCYGFGWTTNKKNAKFLAQNNARFDEQIKNLKEMI